MRFTPTWADLTADVPADQPELLALLYRPLLCQAGLKQAEQEQHYEACARWKRALESGLPTIINVTLPLYLLCAYEPTLEEDRRDLVADVATLDEFFSVLETAALIWQEFPESRQGFAVPHPTQRQLAYFFGFTVVEEDGSQSIVYEGCQTL